MKNKCILTILAAVLLVGIAVGTVFAVRMRSPYVIFVRDDGTAMLSRILRVEGDTLRIPDRINGRLVTKIGKTALLSCEGDLTGVKHLILPDGVGTLENHTFSPLTSLETVTVGQNMSDFSRLAFLGTKLSSVKLKSEDGWFRLIDGCLYDSTGMTLLFGDHIPEETVYIGAYALAESDITEISIPDTVWNIGAGAFYRCEKLTSVTIPGNVISISGHAFAHCTNLTSVTLEEGVRFIGEGAFYNCTSLTSVRIPESAEELGEYAFAASGITDVPDLGSIIRIPAHTFTDCPNLTSAHIPEGVQVLDRLAFTDIPALTSVSFPASLRLIERPSGMWLFGRKLENITVAEENLNYSCEDNQLIDKNTMTLLLGINITLIHDGVRRIGTLKCDPALTALVIPDTVETLEGGAIDSGDGLRYLYIPASVQNMGSYIPPHGEVHIFCEAETQPAGWDADWNVWLHNDRPPVTWGCSREEFEKILSEVQP